MNRFSKENIDKLLFVPSAVITLSWKFRHHILGYLIDFSPVFTLFFWVILGNIIEIEPGLFFLGYLFFIFLSIFFLYYIFVKYYRFKVNKYKIKIEGLNEPISFVFVSDIHLGIEFASTNIFRLRRLIKKINSLNSKVVVLGGDFLSYAFTAREKKIMNEFKKISAEYKIGVYGNHDSEYLGAKQYEHPTEFIKEIENNGIKILLNDGLEIKLGNENFYFAGLPDLYSKDFNIVKAFEACPEKNKRILISHNPDIVEFVEDSDNIDLILSGHNHSGQVFAPFIGPIFPMPGKLKHLTFGIFDIGKKTKLLLSQGFGMSSSRLRIGTDNEICLVELVPEK